MIFSDRQIKQALGTGRVVIDPPPQEDQFAPSAVDLHVGREFRVWKKPTLSSPEPIRLSDVRLRDFVEQMADLPVAEDGTVVIEPGQFVLARTMETVRLPNDSLLAARVEGRSSYARLGLVVHMTAPTIHSGFEGAIVLEMMNFGPYPLRIDPDHTHICQLILEELGDAPSCAISTDFQRQRSVLGGEGQG